MDEAVSSVSSVRSAIAAAPLVCGQTVVYPHLGYPARLEPLFDVSCADAPGSWIVVNEALDPSPIPAATMTEAIARWRTTRAVTQHGTFLVFEPAPPGT